MAKSLKKTKALTAPEVTKAVEEEAEAQGVSINTSDHQLALVPDKSIADRYVGRKIEGKEDHDIFAFAHDQKINVLIEGPTGPGKTTAVMAYAAKHGYPFYAIPSNVGVEPSQLFGKFIPDGNGGFTWQDGPVTDLVRHGGVLLINEVNFMPARVATVLFGLLDLRREIALMDHKAEVIKAHDRLLVVADQNPDYAGTHMLNQAFRNRFAIQLAWDYDPEVEKSLVKSEHLRDMAKNLRDQHTDGVIMTPISTNMLMELERIALEFDCDFALSNFTGHFMSDERPAIHQVVQTFSQNIREDLFGKPEPIVVTDHKGKEWTASMLEALREENYNNPSYHDPEWGIHGIDFQWSDEEEDDDEDDIEEYDHYEDRG